MVPKLCEPYALASGRMSKNVEHPRARSRNYNSVAIGLALGATLLGAIMQSLEETDLMPLSGQSNCRAASLPNRPIEDTGWPNCEVKVRPLFALRGISSKMSASMTALANRHNRLNRYRSSQKESLSTGVS